MEPGPAGAPDADHRPCPEVDGEQHDVAEERPVGSANEPSTAALVLARGLERERGAAATFTAPRFESLAYRDARDHECGDRIEPPCSEQCAPEEPGEDGGGEVGAQEVLVSLALGRGRAQLFGPAGPSRFPAVAFQ